MADVVPFTNLRGVSRTTPTGMEVIVAPIGAKWAAWVRLGPQGFAVLKLTPDRGHALQDGRVYAGRLGIPFSVRLTPIGAEYLRPLTGTGGEISIEISERNGGSWGVVHVSRSGASAAVLANRFGHEQAAAEARRFADQLGAVFDEGCASRSGGDGA